ncbi:MAG: hypothetical protein RSF40_01405 [Oscillospiraceae bacterium]
MSNDRKGYWIIADILHEVGNGNPFGDFESDIFHQDLANIMDYMIASNMSFKKAAKTYMDAEEGNAEWLEEMLEKIGVTL